MDDETCPNLAVMVHTAFVRHDLVLDRSYDVYWQSCSPTCAKIYRKQESLKS